MDEMTLVRQPRPYLTAAQKEILKNKRYAPATGVQADFEKILMRFVETKSVRYEGFAKIWQEKKLSLICAGRSSMREVKEFVEECLKIALKMFLPPYGFQARVGALYLLYGLYYTQPCHPRVQIRVTREAWKHIMDIQKEFQQQNHHDTNYIFCKLLTDRAFTFCHSLEETRGRIGTDSVADSKSLSSALTEEKQSIDQLFSEEVFEQLHMIHTQYHQMKVKLAGPDANRPDRSLDVLQDKFPNSVADHLVKHHERCQMKQTLQRSRKRRKSASDEEFAANSDDEEEDSDPDYQPQKKTVGQRRAALKKQAYTGAKYVQRRKHRTLTVEPTAAEAEQVSAPKPRGRGRPKKVPQNNTADQLPLTLANESAEEQQLKGNSETQSGSQLLNMPHVEQTVKSRTGRRPGRPPKTATGGVTSPNRTKRIFGLRKQAADLLKDRDESGGDHKQERGRPRQQSASQDREDDESVAPASDKEMGEYDTKSVGEEAALSPTTPKRGRGRPPKRKKDDQIKPVKRKKQTADDDDDDDEHLEADSKSDQAAMKEPSSLEKETTLKVSRKRGRPPKLKKLPGKSAAVEQAANLDEEDGDESGDDIIEMENKDKDDENESKEESLPVLFHKRGRGRPKKTDTIPQPQRKRGRPPGTKGKKGKGPIVRPLLVKIGKKYE